jgi:hypothetical protein
MFLVLWLNVDSETPFEHDRGLLLSSVAGWCGPAHEATLAGA